MYTLVNTTKIIPYILLGILFHPAFSQLSKQEKKIIRTVHKQQDKTLALLEQAVNINSGTMNFEGVRRVGQLFQAEFDKMGMETYWVDGSKWSRAGHLVAVQKGKSKKTALLIGHLDTVFEKDSPFQKFVHKKDEIKGPGVADMKGGNMIIVQALKALKQMDLLQQMNIIVVFTGDEEMMGHPVHEARKELVEAAKKADIAIGYEGYDGFKNSVAISRRGSINWTLRVTGKASHSSQIFQRQIGAGAIYETSRILYNIYQQLSSMPNLTINPGVILGGSETKFEDAKNGGTAMGKTNIVSDQVVVQGDLRAVSLTQLEEAKQTIQRIVNQNLPRTKATITFNDGYPPMEATKGNKRLLKILNTVNRDMKLDTIRSGDPRNAGAADISFAANHVEMALDGMGMWGGGAHTIHETANPKALKVESARSAVLLYRLLLSQQ